MQTSADRECVLRNLVSRNVGQLRNRKRAELHAGCGSARLDRVSVIDTRGAGREQPQVAIHAVLVKRNKQVDPVTHTGDLFRAGANGQKSVATTNDGLISIVGIQIEATPAEDLRENVARRGNTLTGRTCDTNSKGRLHHALSSSEPAAVQRPANAPGSDVCISCKAPHPKSSVRLRTAGVYTQSSKNF